MTKRIFSIFSLALAVSTLSFTACSDDSSSGTSATDSSSDAQAVLDIGKMTLREKVGQMFFVRPEALDTSIHWEAYTDLPDFKLQQVNKTMTAVNKDYPIGGMILYAHNIVDETQLASFIKEIRQLNGSPLLAIDEEGGRVARIANNENFDVPKYESMEAIAKTGDPNEAYKAAFTIGSYVKEYGFDMDAIKKACDETIKITSPNLAYVDKILSARYEGTTPDITPSQKRSGRTRLEDRHNYDYAAVEKALFGDDNDDGKDGR